MIHLWLLDPSWERAAKTEVMERRVKNAFEGVFKSLSAEQNASRLDIKYTTTGNKHVIVELKRPEVSLKTADLLEQVGKYRAAVFSVLGQLDRRNEPVEFVCILNKKPSDWKDYDGAEQEHSNSLKAIGARVAMYDELIDNAQKAYGDYAEKQENVSRLYRLITSITEKDAGALSSPLVAE